METQPLTINNFQDVELPDGTITLIYKNNSGKELELLRIGQPEITIPETTHQIQVMIPEDEKISVNVFYTDKNDCLTNNYEIMTVDPVNVAVMEHNVKIKSSLEVFLKDIVHRILFPAIRRLEYNEPENINPTTFV